MTSQERVAEKFTFLLEDGFLPRSVCGDLFLKAIQPLLETHVVVEERAGGGRRLVVRDQVTFAEFAQRLFPQMAVFSELGSRVAGVAQFRSSKAYVSDTPLILSVRSWVDGALTSDGRPTAAHTATAQHGTFSFLLRPDSKYALHGPCALVENPAVFTQFERLGLAINLVIYAQGRAANRLLDWLAGQTDPTFTLLHLPDYDPVGLAEFERLRQRLGGRARLHLPADLEQRFSRFATPALLEAPNSRAILAGLRSSSSAEVQQVLALIHEHNAGLEQEALLVPLS